MKSACWDAKEGAGIEHHRTESGGLWLPRTYPLRCKGYVEGGQGQVRTADPRFFSSVDGRTYAALDVCISLYTKGSSGSRLPVSVPKSLSFAVVMD